jgi:hypothetical protein
MPNRRFPPPWSVEEQDVKTSRRLLCCPRPQRAAARLVSTPGHDFQQNQSNDHYLEAQRTISIDNVC